MPTPSIVLPPDLVQQITAAQSPLYAFILTLMAGQDGAVDVLQETNLKLIRELHRYDTARPFLPWAMTLARFDQGETVRAIAKRLDVTGSDGQRNWDIRGKGPVRVSADSNRFLGGIPGEYQNVPFHDLKSLLEALAENYDLTLRQDDSAPAMQRLHANKRNREKRGLPRMGFLFNEDTGRVMWMELHGLPQEKGGPRAVRLTLTSESAFPADFFTHDAHHEAGREVMIESANLKP